MEWMIMPLKRYAEFTGRSRRMEYWMFTLFTVIVMTVLVLISGLGSTLFNPEAMMAAETSGEMPVGFGIGIALIGIFGLAIVIPSIAVTVRRLHDRDMSGWWYLGAIVGGMIPFIGFLVSIAFLVLMFLPGTPGPNRFGPDPKDPTSSSVFE